MKVPPNMTENQVLETIDIVIKRISPKYTFKDYDLEDIKQESFIICLDALHRYDGQRSLENFLSVNLSNRLKNFVRDNHYVKNNIHKKKIKAPQYIIDENIIHSNYDIENELISMDLSETIDKQLPASMREDYLKILNDVPVNKSRREKIFNQIRMIIDNEKG